MPTADKVRAALEELAPTQEKVDLAVKTAIEIANPSRVFIFGSWARGEATINSDLDLAVLFSDDRKAELGELHTKISKELRRIPMSIDLIVASEGYAAEFVSSVNSVYYKILHRGRLVYDGANRQTSSGAAYEGSRR
jgi:predicted nucleotidyltransferase